MSEQTFIALEVVDLSQSHQAQADFAVICDGNRELSVGEGSTAGWSKLVQKPVPTGSPVSGQTVHATAAIFRRQNCGASETLIIEASAPTTFSGHLKPFAI